VLSLDLSALVTVQRTPSTGEPTVTKDVYIEHVDHRISSRPGERQQWTASYQLSPTQSQQFWLLGDPVAGVLGSSTRLTY
jgi:hypothetical protein